MKYLMFGICTENYKDAFEFAIKSWTRQNASKIIIYSDITWDYPGVEIKKVLDKSTNWQKNICLKATCSKLALQEGYENVVFVDMDCYLRGDLGHVFEKDFDIATTELQRKGNISTGCYFMKNTESTNRFIDRWIKEVDKIGDNYGSRFGTLPKDQVTFSIVAENNNDHHLIDLPKSRYNRKIKLVKRNEKQLNDIKNDDSLVLHFYNKSYLSAENISEVFGALGEDYK